MLNHLALIFLGAGAGGVARHLVGGWVQGAPGPGFPLGTLAVNVSGCLAIGLLAAALDGPSREPWRLSLLVGVLGGYTTFSSFGRETIELLQRGDWPRAALYVLLSNVLGLGAVWAGLAVAAAVRGRLGT